MKHNIKLTVNGELHLLEVESHNTLLSILRDKLGLTGTKEGCGMGECGACVVLVDGSPINSCLTLAVEVDGKEIITIEGIAKEGKLNKIQEAFITNNAIQCGFCTPGIIIATFALLNRIPKPSKGEIVEALKGHLCRCTGYESIINAVESIYG